MMKNSLPAELKASKCKLFLKENWPADKQTVDYIYRLYLNCF